MPFFGKKNYSTVKVRKRDIPDGLWLKCPSCNEIIFRQELNDTAGVCPKCDHHFPLGRRERIDQLLEPGSYREWDANLASMDILEFTGKAGYESKLKKNIEKTGALDAISTGRGNLGRHRIGFGVMDFAFLGASMGSVVGEKVTRLFERATDESLPVLLCCASGGARMYEGMFSLMQMAKTSGAIERHRHTGKPFIALLTNPTMAGVMASFATLGDFIIAEPGALIGFAGPRVIKETTQQDLPEGFQRSEFLLKHGLLDKVVHRGELKQTIDHLLSFTSGGAGE